MLTHTSPVSADFLSYHHCLSEEAATPLIFVDIETMGLSHRRDPIILIGMMVISNGAGTLFQYFSQSPKEERLILEAFISCIPANGPIFTYNGRSFDIPYINHRLAHHRINYQIPAPRGVDLMHWAKSAFPESPRHTLKTIEACLGIHREDVLSGADCVRQYQDYLISQEPQLASDICRHNYEDILHLAPLLQLHARLPAKSPLRVLPLCLNVRDRFYWAAPPVFRNDAMTIMATTASTDVPGAVCYCGSASLEIHRGDLSVTLPVLAFDYPVAGSLYIDCDRIPGYSPQPFNSLPTVDKLAMLVRKGTRTLADPLSQSIARLLSL